jgi:hypothetical protein
MHLSICSFSLHVMQNMAKCAQRLSTTRKALFGMSFYSAWQCSGGKNVSWERDDGRLGLGRQRPAT